MRGWLISFIVMQENINCITQLVLNYSDFFSTRTWESFCILAKHRISGLWQPKGKYNISNSQGKNGEKIDWDYRAILWHALILNIMVHPVHLRNCTTQRQKLEKKKVKKNDQKYKVVSRDQTINFPGWKPLKVRNTMSVKEWKMNREQVIAGFVKSKYISTQWNQI